MFSTNRTRILGVACVLALLLAGCGKSNATKPKVIIKSTASLSKVPAAMRTQPRIIET